MRRMLLSIATVVLLGYVGICALLYFNQRALTYYPEFTRVPVAETDFRLTRGGVTLRGWIVNPGRRDAVVYFGGNAERIEASRADFARWFPEDSVYLLAYRGYGASEGQPEERALLADALALFDEVKRRHPDGRIAVIGRSLGGGIASHLAARRPVARLALVTPFDSLAEVAQAHYPLIPVRWLLRDRYESTRQLAGYRGPVLVIRAERDRIVPAASTRALILALPAPPRVLVVPGADHNDVSVHDAYWPTLSEFMRD